MDDAVFTFNVWHSPGYPICPDVAVSRVSVLGEDSPAGLIRAGELAAQMVGASTGTAMVTSIGLLDVEL